MKAVVYSEYGSPDNLIVKEINKPVPKGNEVLVKVHSVALNDYDLGLLLGKPFVNRLFFGLFRPKLRILGCDIAGIIEEIGSDVKRFAVGAEVYGDISPTFGGFAEYVCAKETSLIEKPKKMTFGEAAAIPQAAVLALQGIRDVGLLKPGQHLLINGAGGGVGTFGVQIAKQHDVEVSGVDHTDKLEMMSLLGFDHVIDYTKEDFTETGKRYDLIIDNKTNRSVFKYVRSLQSNGTYVTIGGKMRWILQAMFLSPIISLVFKKKIKMVALSTNKGLEYINELYEKGLIKPIVDKSFNLNEIPDAMRFFGEGLHKGKVVISVVREN